MNSTTTKEYRIRLAELATANQVQRVTILILAAAVVVLLTRRHWRWAGRHRLPAPPGAE